MPYTVPIREGYPTVFETLPKIGIIRGSREFGVDYYNLTTKTIIPGEPVFAFGMVGVVAKAVLPGEWCRLLFGCVVDFLVNPAMVTQVLQNAQVNFDIDLASAGDFIPGYATGATPTNGYRLGRAVGIVAKPNEIVLSSSKPVAARATPGAGKRIRVLMDYIVASNTFGTVQVWV